MLKIIGKIIFIYYCLKYKVKGTIQFINSECHWYARHVLEHVEVNLVKTNTVSLLRKKILHEVWHLYQLRDNKEKLLFLEQVVLDCARNNMRRVAYLLNPAEIDAWLVENGKRPGLFDSVSLDSLVFYHETGVLFGVLRLKALEYLESQGYQELDIYQQILHLTDNL